MTYHPACCICEFMMSKSCRVCKMHHVFFCQCSHVCYPTLELSLSSLLNCIRPQGNTYFVFAGRREFFPFVKFHR
uniref:Uncharacterized protein n=1 Tax=Setaria italica TaxID=4555 RepID=K4ANM7_SETIT